MISSICDAEAIKDTGKTVAATNMCAVCDQKSTSKCSNCKQAYYCSVGHQKADWRRHKSECHPFQIASNDRFGRYLIASRDIKAGEIIIKEAPLIQGPSQITCPVCVGCLNGLKESLQLECDRCGWPICSRRCQDRPQHQYECQLTVARGSKVSLQHYFSPHPTYQCISTLRCLLLKHHEPEKWAKLIQLESHCKKRHGSVQWRNDREGVAKFIPRFFKCDHWTEEEILKVAGIVQVNGHEVPLTEPAYVAVYHFASLIEHSCLPNLTKSFTAKGELMFWTTQDIRAGDHLSICYSDALWGTANRQHHLMQTKMFKCECIRCLDVTEVGTFYSAVKCKNSDACAGMMLPKCLDTWDHNWTCNICGLSVEYKYVNTILDRAGKDLNAMEKGNEQNCIRYLEHYSKWLPNKHYYMTDVKVALAQIIGSGGPDIIQGTTEDELNMKIQLCQELLKLFDVISSAEARVLGAISFELHAGLAELGRRGAQQLNDTFRGALEESLITANKVIYYLQHEPAELSEGQLCAQARVNAESLRVLLAQSAGMEI